MSVYRIAALVLLGVLAPASVAKAPAKPSIKVMGFSINRFYSSKGATVKQGQSTNGCYIIGGASGEPDSLTVYVYVKAVKIPPGAHMTYTFSTPWDSQTPDQRAFAGTFSKGLHKATPAAAGVFGGPTGKQYHFTYRMLPTGTPASYYIDGKYSLNVRVVAGGKTLTSYGKITVAC